MQIVLEGLLKHRWLGCSPRASDPVGLRYDLRIFFSNKVPDTDAAGLMTILPKSLTGIPRRYCGVGSGPPQ